MITRGAPVAATTTLALGVLACGPLERAPTAADVEAPARGAGDGAPSAVGRGATERDPITADAPGAGPAPSTLTQERDRLLDTMSDGRCATWSALDDDQRAVFLVVTDLLGKRSALPSGASALAHVERLHAVRGRQHDGCLRCCGDREFNRAYLSADAELLAAVRAHALGAWRDTRDLGGPHEPFTASRETHVGQPRGQLHVFAADGDAVVLARPGVEDVLDPRALEIDLDFNLLHESAPTCEYGGELGTARYQALWSSEGQGGDAELAYAPTGC